MAFKERHHETEARFVEPAGVLHRLHDASQRARRSAEIAAGSFSRSRGEMGRGFKRWSTIALGLLVLGASELRAQTKFEKSASVADSLIIPPFPSIPFADSGDYTNIDTTKEQRDFVVGSYQKGAENNQYIRPEMEMIVWWVLGGYSKDELQRMSPVELRKLYDSIGKGLTPEQQSRLSHLLVLGQDGRWVYATDAWAAMTGEYGRAKGDSRSAPAATGPDPEPKPEPKLPEPKPKQVAPPAPKPTSPPPVVNPPKDTGEESFFARWFGDLFGSKEKKSESAAGKGNPPEPKKPPEVKPPEKDKPPVAPPPEPPNKVPQPEKKAPSVWDNIHKPTGMGWERAAEEVLKAKSQNRKASAEAERAYSAWQDYFDAVLQTITVKKTGEKLSIDYLNGLSADPNAQLEAFKLVDRYLVSLLTKKPGQPDLTPQEREAYSIVLMWERAVMDELKKDLGIK